MSDPAVVPAGPPVGETFADRYMLEALVDYDARRAVYRAHDSELQQTVAISVFSETLAADAPSRGRFERAAELLALVEHPNLARILHSGVIGRTGFVVHEWLDGESLAGRLRSGGLTKDEALAIVLQLLAALAAAHARSLAHGNLRPHTLFLQRRLHADASVKVLDFGVPKLVAALMPAAQARSAAGLTRALGEGGDVRRYAAPECLAGQAPDPRSDVFAVGVMLSELLVREATGLTRLDASAPSVAGGAPALASIGELADLLEAEPAADGGDGIPGAPATDGSESSAADGGESFATDGSESSAADGGESSAADGGEPSATDGSEPEPSAFATLPEFDGAQAPVIARAPDTDHASPPAELEAGVTSTSHIRAIAAGSELVRVEVVIEPALQSLIDRAKSVDRAERFAGAADMLTALVDSFPRDVAAPQQQPAWEDTDIFGEVTTVFQASQPFPYASSQQNELRELQELRELNDVESHGALAAPQLQVELLRPPAGSASNAEVRPPLAAGMLVVMVVGVMTAMWLSNREPPVSHDPVRSVALSPTQAVPALQLPAADTTGASTLPPPPRAEPAAPAAIGGEASRPAPAPNAIAREASLADNDAPRAADPSSRAERAQGESAPASVQPTASARAVALPATASLTTQAAPPRAVTLPAIAALTKHAGPTGAAQTETSVSAVREAEAVPQPKAAAQAKAPAPRAVNTVPAQNPWLAAVPVELQAIRAKVGNGIDIDDAAIRALRVFNYKQPRDPRGHLLLGRAFLKRYWRADGLSEIALALRIDPGARGAPEVLPLLIKLVTDGRFAEPAAELIARVYGDEALDAIEDALSRTRGPAVAERLHVLHGRVLAAE